jgi:hypothetical protein
MSPYMLQSGCGFSWDIMVSFSRQGGGRSAKSPDFAPALAIEQPRRLAG